MTGESLGEELFATGINSDPREASSFDTHLKDRQGFGRNQVSEPQSSTDLRFLERFKRPHVQQLINN
jgi:hypothetical protein